MDEIYENCAIVPIIPIAHIIPTISIMEAYRHKKTRIDAFGFVHRRISAPCCPRTPGWRRSGLLFVDLYVLISKNYIYILPYEKPCIRFF